MSDFTVKEMIKLLETLPKDARVGQHSGEGGGILYIISKNGNKSWSILQDGKLK